MCLFRFVGNIERQEIWEIPIFIHENAIRLDPTCYHFMKIFYEPYLINSSKSNIGVPYYGLSLSFLYLHSDL